MSTSDIRIIREPEIYVVGRQTVNDAELDRFLSDLDKKIAPLDKEYALLSAQGVTLRERMIDLAERSQTMSPAQVSAAFDAEIGA